MPCILTKSVTNYLALVHTIFENIFILNKQKIIYIKNIYFP